MKALLLSLLIVVGLDQVVGQGAGMRACCQMVVRLFHGTESSVSGSVYRQ